MRDMIAIGEAWFEQQRREHLAVEVEYRPVVGAARTVRATVVIGRWEQVDAAGQILRTETRDWMVHRSELAQDPRKGDIIAATESGYEVLYEVSIPPGGQHHWRWSDRSQNLRRIHTMVVQGALDRRPAAPAAPTGISGSHLGVVSWTAPTTTGGSPVTEYRVYVNGVIDETVTAPETQTVGTYSAGTSVQVSAVNAVGEGAKSAAVLVAATVPSAPVILQALDGQPLYWSTPADGGSPLTSYKLYRDGVLVEPDDPLTSFSSGSADAYASGSVMTVRAVNAVGDGALSAPVTVT